MNTKISLVLILFPLLAFAGAPDDADDLSLLPEGTTVTIPEAQTIEVKQSMIDLGRVALVSKNPLVKLAYFSCQIAFEPATDKRDMNGNFVFTLKNPAVSSFGYGSIANDGQSYHSFPVQLNYGAQYTFGSGGASSVQATYRGQRIDQIVFACNDSIQGAITSIKESIYTPGPTIGDLRLLLANRHATLVLPSHGSFP